MRGDVRSGRGARVVPVPPPVYYAAALFSGLLLDRAHPWPLGGRPATILVGAVLAAAGLAVAGAGAAAVVRHRTTIVPHRPVTTLVTTGPYRWCRNPMYTGLAVAHLGASLAIGSFWQLILVPVPLLLVEHLVIRPEEQYLTEQFGVSYADYRARVRRWL